jgi:hypothetical protein
MAFLTMEVQGGYGRARPGDRDHVFTANRLFEECQPCTRVPARARSHVPVSYLRLVAQLQNAQQVFIGPYRRSRDRSAARLTRLGLERQINPSSRAREIAIRTSRCGRRSSAPTNSRAMERLHDPSNDYPPLSAQPSGVQASAAQAVEQSPGGFGSCWRGTIKLVVMRHRAEA